MSASRQETGRRILATRLALGVKIKFILQETGISKTQWSNYERCVSRPNVEDGIRFCERFGITMDWIYRGDPSCLPHSLAIKIQEAMQKLSDEQADSRNK